MKNKLIFFLLFWIIPFKYGYTQEEIKKNPILTDKFHFGVGLFMPSKNIKISANGSALNDLIDFDETFKFNHNEITPTFTFNWRLFKKWKLNAEYFKVQNSNKAVLKEDIVWDEYIFRKGSSITGGFRFDLYRIFIGRAFSQGEKHEFGGGLGLHAINIGPFIEGVAYINDDEFSFEKISLSSLAPLPNIGIWYYFAPSPKWVLTTNLDWFAITIDEYYVSLWDVEAGIKYQFFKNFGLSINYRYFKTIAHVNNSNWNGKFNMVFQGPIIGVIGNF